MKKQDDKPSVWIQFLAALVCGVIGFALVSNDPNPKVPLVSGLIFGFGGSWLFSFLTVWRKAGWGAARSMRIWPTAQK
jgi:hypothetical protein